MAFPKPTPLKTAANQIKTPAKTPARTAMPSLNSDAGLNQYLSEIRRFPLLEPQEEYKLAKQWRDAGDREAVQILVTSHLRLVAKIAMGYRGYGLPVADLIAEGNMGMMQAVRKFEPERGFRLSTYAMWWIKAAIQEYILKSWSLVKIGTTAAQKKLFFNLRRIKNELREYEDTDLTPEQVKLVATRLAVPEHEVVSMNRRLGGPDNSLNTPRGSSADGEAAGEWQDWLPDASPDQESTVGELEERRQRQGMFRDALDTLNPRERHILAERRLREPPSTLEDLSQHYKISRERVRQIENRAFDKIRDVIAKNAMAQITGEKRAALPGSAN